ncbi:MAG: response regulator [Spirochaetales bacterium]|nr:response regulator [Spirochaetales bacterium]
MDLVLMDMIMPDMHGRECFFRIKDIRSQIPVILASGFLKAEDLSDLKAKGLSGFIQKPFTSAELSRIVSKVLLKGME